VDVFNPRALLLLTPVMPAAGGNGLAMRAGAHLVALAHSYDVAVVVVPVAGGSPDASWAEQHASSVALVVPRGPDEVRAGLMRLVREATWRDRLRSCEPFPATVTQAGLALAAQVVEAAGGMRRARVHALRAYLGPLAVAVAEELAAPWATLDLDDDDEHLQESEGRIAEAQAYGRLLETFGPEFRWLSLASPEDAERVAARHSLPTVVVPNSVAVPHEPLGRTRRQGGRASLLFVGNMTYGPNAEAAVALVRAVLPRVRQLVDRPVQVELVGSYEPGGPVEALAGDDGVAVRGQVADLEDAYACADAAVVPIERGSGTRIKLLEALAAGVPVVTTPVGAAGLGAEPGRHIAVGGDADELAAAVARVVLDEQFASGLVREGRSFVEERFSAGIVGLRLRELAIALEPASSSDDEPAGGEL
jgi:glycosyltransferase involved in cell wall biosynthesis